MPIKYTVTVTALGTSSVIVLPKPIVDGFNLGKGHKLELIVKDDGIYIPLEEQISQNSTNATAFHEDTKK
jgi:bifunctional DNA-binding transcriptional regulator/antitoxin component of YhaV-PrlF toxin-antitoxin module